jgi:hypothetical protein
MHGPYVIYISVPHSTAIASLLQDVADGGVKKKTEKLPEGNMARTVKGAQPSRSAARYCGAHVIPRCGKHSAACAAVACGAALLQGGAA